MGDLLAHEDSGGSGVPVVLLHAFPFDRRMWSRQRETLARHTIRTVAVDLAGFGASRALSRDSVDEHADDVAHLLDHVAVPRAIVVGLSMGGYVAMAFARRHDARLAGLLLADTRASGDTDEAKAGRAANVERARREGAVAVFDAMTKAWSAQSLPEHVAEMRAIAAEQSVEGVVAALEMMRDRPDADLSAVRVPTSIVVGSADALTPPALAEDMARAIPGSTLHVLEGAGHFTNVERAAEFDRVLLDLVRRSAR